MPVLPEWLKYQLIMHRMGMNWPVLLDVILDLSLWPDLQGSYG